MIVWTTPSPPPPPPPPPPHLRSRLSPHWQGMKCNSTTWWNKAFQFWRRRNESLVDLSSYSLISVALFLCIFFIRTSRLLHLWNSIFIPPPLPLPPSLPVWYFLHLPVHLLVPPNLFFTSAHLSPHLPFGALSSFFSLSSFHTLYIGLLSGWYLMH